LESHPGELFYLPSSTIEPLNSDLIRMAMD